MALFVTKNGQTFGPHEADEIIVFLGTGTFFPDDFCWQEGWTDWRPISSVLPVSTAPSESTAIASEPTPRSNGQIPHDIEIIGTLKLPDERTVTCRVEGEILSPSTVIIPRENCVKAHIKAESVIIFGSVEGNIHATGRAVLKSSSTLHGDIHAARVLVEEGAAFNGKSHVNSNHAPPSKKNEEPAARKTSTTPPPSAAAAKSPARPA